MPELKQKPTSRTVALQAMKILGQPLGRLLTRRSIDRALYVAAKLGNMILVQVYGGIVISLIVPSTVTLLGYVREKAKRRTTISHVFILFYLSLELLLDYILKISFREILAIHVPYIIFFYAALFSMIGVSFEKNKKMASVVVATFLILIGCLVYYLIP